MIVNTPGAFCDEIGEKLLLMGEEIVPTDVVDDQIHDVLALDEQGSTVVVELKRGLNKLHLLQALSYAAMVSEWDSVQGLDNAQLAKRKKSAAEGHRRAECTQRVLLIAEEYDYQVLRHNQVVDEDVRGRYSLLADGI